MKRKFTVTFTEDLRSLCIRKNWFTCGTNRQYEKLFQMNKELAPIEEIATVIWLCSDEEEHSRRDILEALKEAQEEYLMELAEYQIAEGERTADEIYCGQFD